MNLILYFWLIFSRRIPIVSRLIEHFVYVEIPVLRDYQMAYLKFRSVSGRDISIKATVSNIFLSESSTQSTRNARAMRESSAHLDVLTQLSVLQNVRDILPLNHLKNVFIRSFYFFDQVANILKDVFLSKNFYTPSEIYFYFFIG